MEEQSENAVGTRGANRNTEVKRLSIESVIEDVNDQENIDLLIARLQAKKSRKKIMDKSTDGSVATKGELHFSPEEPLDWDNIHGEDSFINMMLNDQVS